MTGLVEAIDPEISTPRRLGHTHHLTLAVYPALEPDRIQPVLMEFTATERPLNIIFPSIGAFPGEQNVLFLAPVVTEELLRLHLRYHELARQNGPCEAHYHPGSWFPHLTLAVAMSSAFLTRAVSDMAAEWAPVRARIEAVRLVQFNPVETVWLADLDKK